MYRERSILKILAIALVSALILQGCNFLLKKPPGTEGTQQSILLKQGDDLVRKGQYEASRVKFNKILKQYASSDEAREARYMLARSYEFEGDEQMAIEEYTKYINDYKSDDELTKSLAYLRRIETSRYEASILLAEQKQAGLRVENEQLNKSLAKLREAINSQKIYLTIDTTKNVLSVKMGIGTLHAYPVVTGKGFRLLKTSGKKKNFSTPPGVHKVIRKEENPVWYRPNWYWLEKGLEVPEDLTRADRAVPGVLGKHKVDLGNGYYIHGTRSGKVKAGNFSHGCMRMNKADLENVYNLVEKGTYVFIY